MARVTGRKGDVWKRYDRPSVGAKTAILVMFGVIAILPFIGMLYFTFRSATGGFTLDHWISLFTGENRSLEDVGYGLLNSIIVVIVTLLIQYILVIPAFVLIFVHFPRLQRMMRVLMLLPIAIPAIILVVGFAPMFALIAQVFDSGIWTLALAYGVIALPFVYTTISADLSGLQALTLTQAAQSLGASWLRTLIDILLPCLRRSISNATLITTAIVLGEYTIASLLNRETLQTDLVYISSDDAYLSVIVSLIVTVGTFAALFVVSVLGERRKLRTKQ